MPATRSCGRGCENAREKRRKATPILTPPLPYSIRSARAHVVAGGDKFGVRGRTGRVIISEETVFPHMRGQNAIPIEKSVHAGRVLLLRGFMVGSHFTQVAG